MVFQNLISDMNTVIKFIPSEGAKKLMLEIVERIASDVHNKNQFDCGEIEAVWFIRYTSKTAEEGEVVLRFQETKTIYGRLTVPALSLDENDDRYTESSVGPLKYVIWTIRFSDIFKIDGKGMSARVFVREGIFDTLRGLGGC